MELVWAVVTLQTYSLCCLLGDSVNIEQQVCVLVLQTILHSCS